MAQRAGHEGWQVRMATLDCTAATELAPVHVAYGWLSDTVVDWCTNLSGADGV